MTVDDEILQRLHDAAGGASSWSDIRAALVTGDAEGAPDMRLRPFVFAFAYNLIDSLSERRQEVGEPYGSLFSGDGERFPPRIADPGVVHDVGTAVGTRPRSTSRILHPSSPPTLANWSQIRALRGL